MYPHLSVPLKLAAERPPMPRPQLREPVALPGWMALVIVLPLVVAALAVWLAISACRAACCGRW